MWYDFFMFPYLKYMYRLVFSLMPEMSTSNFLLREDLHVLGGEKGMRGSFKLFGTGVRSGCVNGVYDKGTQGI